MIQHFRSGIRLIILLLCVGAPALLNATNYYMTQSGAGTGDGTLGNAKSVANNNSGFWSVPTAGDTLFITGTVSTEINLYAAGNGGAQLVVDASGATFTPAMSGSATGAINITTNYVTFTQGGTFSGGSGNIKTHTTGGTITLPATVASFPNNHAIKFNTGQIGVIIDGVTVTGGASGTALLVNAQYSSNFTIQNCYSNGNAATLIYSDGGPPHDLSILNNLFVGSANAATESDVVHIGDAYNVTIQGNYFFVKAPGDTTGRHNDVLQNYQSGSLGAASPYGWVIRYNYFGLDVTGGDGNTSFTQFEHMKDSGGTPAMKMYANIWEGIGTTNSNNGVSMYGSDTAATAYWYNNTVIAPTGHPGNTVTFQKNGSNADVLYSRNNIGYDPTGGGGTYVSWTYTAGATWDYNFFFNWGTQTTPAGTHGSSTTNPSFTNAGASDYSLGSGSALKGVGDSAIGAEFNQGIAAGATWPNPALVTRSTWDVGGYNQSASSSSFSSALIGKAGLIGKAQTK